MIQPILLLCTKETATYLGENSIIFHRHTHANFDFNGQSLKLHTKFILPSFLQKEGRRICNLWAQGTRYGNASQECLVGFPLGWGGQKEGFYGLGGFQGSMLLSSGVSKWQLEDKNMVLMDGTKQNLNCDGLNTLLQNIKQTQISFFQH